MKRTFVAMTLAVSLALTASGVAGAAALERDTCIDSWSEAARIVKKENLTTVEDLAASAERVLGGTIVRTALCKDGERYVYSLVIRKSGGALSRARVDARKPF